MAFAANTRLSVTVTEDAATTSQTSATFDGVTFTFDRAMPVGTFVTGEPFVVADQAFAITAISPAASDIESDGAIGNGTMQDPWFFESQLQGFDGYLADYPTKVTYQTPYSAALNVDPAINGNIAIALGEKTSIVKSIRDAGKTSNVAQHYTIEKYIQLSVLDAAPPADAYPPAAAGTAKTLYRRADWAGFTSRGIAMPASLTAKATLISRAPANLGLYTGGEQHRFTRTEDTSVLTGNGYSADITPTYAQYVMLANSTDVTEPERQAIIDKIISFTAQIEGVIDVGGNLNYGAGQGGAIWLWAMAGAALMQNDTLLQKIRGATIQPDASPLWVQASDVGVAAPGKSGIAAQTYFAEHVGQPWVQPDELGSHHEARYAVLAAAICMWEYCAVLPFNSGPVGKTNGTDLILNGGANDSTNDFAAGLNLAARARTWTPSTGTFLVPTTQLKDAWDLMTTLGDFTPWTGIPDQPPRGTATGDIDEDYFTGGDGQITLNALAGFDYATEAVTQRDMRYSLDGVQFVEALNIGALPYTQTGLLKGATHWCGWRQHSASGTGIWSGNYPQATPIDSGLHLNRATTTGTEANAAPVNTVAPQIHARLYPAWDYKIWSPASGTLPLDDVFLSAGVGYWSGFPSPTFTYQWKRDGVNIGGETSAEYQRVAADAGTVLTCEITATNSQGSASITTAGVTCPAIQNPPAGTIIDTNFRGRFAIDYEAELLSVAGPNYTITHEPNLTPSGEATVNTGALKFAKNTSNPIGTMDIDRAATASTIYDLDMQIVIQGDAVSNRADFVFTIEEVGGVPLFTETVVWDSTPQTEDLFAIIDIADTFTTATITDLRFKVTWLDGTGGTAGGQVYLTRLEISEQ